LLRNRLRWISPETFRALLSWSEWRRTWPYTRASHLQMEFSLARICASPHPCQVPNRPSFLRPSRVLPPPSFPSLPPMGGGKSILAPSLFTKRKGVVHVNTRISILLFSEWPYHLLKLRLQLRAVLPDFWHQYRHVRLLSYTNFSILVFLPWTTSSNASSILVAPLKSSFWAYQCGQEKESKISLTSYPLLMMECQYHLWKSWYYATNF